MVLGALHCIAGRVNQYFILDYNGHCQPNGSHRIGVFGCCGENHRLCDAAANGDIVGSGNHDGTELRCGTDTADEQMPGFGHWDCPCFRCIGLCVFPIPAGDAYRILFQRCGGGGNGGGVSAGYSIDCIIVSFVFCINSYFSGQNSLFPMIHSLIATFLFRIPLSYWFSQIDSSSLFLMGFAPPLSTVASLLICIWYLRYNQRECTRKALRCLLYRIKCFLSDIY